MFVWTLRACSVSRLYLSLAIEPRELRFMSAAPCSYIRHHSSAMWAITLVPDGRVIWCAFRCTAA